jgi:hypothetical protein
MMRTDEEYMVKFTVEGDRCNARQVHAAVS